jgi:phenylacetate-CoA ligase
MSWSEWITRRLTYPAYERCRGRSTLRVLARLQALAKTTPPALRTYTNQRLRDLLAFAGTRLPYYAHVFARCGIDPLAADVQAELRKLPLLEKAEVRAQTERMVWRDVPGGALPHASGGTTGDALHFFIDRVRQAEDLGARLFMQGLFGVHPGDRRLHLWGSPIEAKGAGLKRWRDRLLNERLLDAFHLAPTQLDAHLARIGRFKPRVIYGYPTALTLLARHAVDSNTSLSFPWLRLIVLTGEEVRAAQIAQIHATFGCAVASEYGNREVGLIAHDCRRGRMHILSPHIHLDITRAGQNTETERCGDVACTTLNTRAQPFIRYRLGDVGRRLADPCPCGLPFPTLRLEGGKITGFVALPDGRLCHGAITSHVLRDEPGLVEFKTYQHTLEEFEVLLVVDERFDPATIARVCHRYRALFGPRVNVECRIVDHIPPDPSGKRRYVVSAIAPNYSGFDLVDLPPETSNTGSARSAQAHRSTVAADSK